MVLHGRGHAKEDFNLGKNLRKWLEARANSAQGFVKIPHCFALAVRRPQPGVKKDAFQVSACVCLRDCVKGGILSDTDRLYIAPPLQFFSFFRDRKDI